jgi:hypothetical protein
MSEEEYVHTAKRAAQDYISQIRMPDEMFGPTLDRWEQIKLQLSPHTFVRMCHAFLEKEAAK